MSKSVIIHPAECGNLTIEYKQLLKLARKHRVYTEASKRDEVNLVELYMDCESDTHFVALLRNAAKYHRTRKS